MLTTDFPTNQRMLDAAENIHIMPGGLSALVNGELYEADSPAALSARLGSVIYQTVHVGWAEPQSLGVRTYRHPAFEQQLMQHLPPMSRHVTAQLVAAPDDATTAEPVALIKGVRVRVPQSRLRTPGTDPNQVEVQLPCARPGLSPGFLYMNGEGVDGPGQTLRLYAHLNAPEDAPEVWAVAVEQLRSRNLSWNAKVLSAPFLYPRNDALVIYLRRDGWKHARAIAEAMQATGKLGEGLSPFVKPVTAGCGAAFDPIDSRVGQEGHSFGTHRASALAHALVGHASSHGAPEDLPEALFASFTEAGIDPAEPARNLSSPMTEVIGLH